MHLTAVNESTVRLVKQGHRVFQIHRFADGEKSHVGRLLRWAELPANANLIDMGSGTGEVARIMMVGRPDLSFTLVNISQLQLDYSPENTVKICGDFCNVAAPDGSFDAVLFCFAIGHADIDKALAEAYRLLKPGGILFIYDMVRTGGSNESMKSVEYVVNSKQENIEHMQSAGFTIDYYMEPSDNGDYARSVIGCDFDVVFDGTIPAIWRLIK